MIQQTYGIEVRKTIAAPRQRVFDAWKQPEALRHWWGNWGNYLFHGATLDFRVGGRYEFHMAVKNKDIVRTSHGEYLEIDEPARLVFTWNWTHDEAAASTVVTLEFHELDPATTELVLRHDRFPDADIADKHRQGWTMAMEALEVHSKAASQ